VNELHEASWAQALEVAQRPTEPELWQQQLADALEHALRPDAVGFFLCSAGNILEATSAIAPREHASLGPRFVNEWLPRLHGAGLITPSDLFQDATDAEQRAILRPLHDELLGPAGFGTLTGRFLRSKEGMVTGWSALFMRSSSRQRASEIEAPLAEVCRAAQHTLRTSIALASRMGARFPRLSPVLLSRREREIAQLAANGCSDLNIAERLHIREGTVGRHMHNIFRKLGVGSRRELSVLLGGRE
jgi:DNA-binding CsgD family transcriptional regulator